MKITWKLNNISRSYFNNIDKLGKVVMSELGIDSGEYKVEGRSLVGSPFPFKLKWWVTAKQFCIYDVSIKRLGETGVEIQIRIFNLFFIPLALPVISFLIGVNDGLFKSAVLYLVSFLFLAVILLIELAIVKRNIKEALMTTNNSIN